MEPGLCHAVATSVEDPHAKAEVSILVRAPAKDEPAGEVTVETKVRILPRISKGGTRKVTADATETGTAGKPRHVPEGKAETKASGTPKPRPAGTTKSRTGGTPTPSPAGKVKKPTSSTHRPPTAGPVKKPGPSAKPRPAAVNTPGTDS